MSKPSSSRPEDPESSATKAGALPSLREIFDEHARYIWRALRHFGVAEPDIEDVAQEVFITVHRKLPEFEGRSSLKTWIYGICLRVASDYRRRAHVRRERATENVADLVDGPSAPVPENRVESRETLRALLDLLDDEKRQVFVLYESEGFTMKEIAEIVGCPLQTAYSRLYSARERLLAAVREQEKALK